MEWMPQNMMHNGTLTNGSIDPTMMAHISGGPPIGYQPMSVTYAPSQATVQIIDGGGGVGSHGSHFMCANRIMSLSKQPSPLDGAGDEMPPLPNLEPQEIEKYDECCVVPV